MRLNKWGYLIREGFRSIMTHGFMSFATVTIIIACLIIMGSVTLLSVNIDAFIADLENENEVVGFPRGSVGMTGAPAAALGIDETSVVNSVIGTYFV